MLEIIKNIKSDTAISRFIILNQQTKNYCFELHPSQVIDSGKQYFLRSLHYLMTAVRGKLNIEQNLRY